MNSWKKVRTNTNNIFQKSTNTNKHKQTRIYFKGLYFKKKQISLHFFHWFPPYFNLYFPLLFNLLFVLSLFDQPYSHFNNPLPILPYILTPILPPFFKCHILIHNLLLLASLFYPLNCLILPFLIYTLILSIWFASLIYLLHLPP